jgi:outer membrane autotransporter protein
VWFRAYLALLLVRLKALKGWRLHKAVFLAYLTILSFTTPVLGQQTLNQAVDEQLQKQLNTECFMLRRGDANPIVPGFGPQLQEICATGGGTTNGSGVSAGGGATTTQGFRIDIKRRLNAAQGKQEPVALKNGVMFGGLGDVAVVGESAGLPSGGRWPIVPNYERQGRDQTTFEAGKVSDKWGVIGVADYQFLNPDVRRIEEKHHNIANGSKSSSFIASIGGQTKYKELLHSQRVMLASSDPTNAVLAFSESAGDLLRVTGVDIQKATADSAIIRIHADQPVVKYNTFMLTDPPRIVIDIAGALLAKPTLREAAGKGPIKKIRSSQFRLKPEPVVRVVLDLATTLPFQVVGLPDTFRLLIGEVVETADQVETPEIATGPLRVRGVEIQEATANSAIIRIQADQAVIDYNTFMLTDPPRIVIDIAGALLDEPMLKEEAGKGPIRQIRSSQYRRKPEPVVRVVLDLTSTLAYRVAGLPDTFQLFIGEAVAKTDQLKPPVLPQVTAERPKPDTEELFVATKAVDPIRPKVGIWASGEYEDLDRDVTTFEDGYDSDIWRVTIGADYQFTDQILAGLALGYNHWSGDFESGGDFDVNTLGLIAYASLFTLSGVFGDATLGYARTDYERSRLPAWADSVNNTVLTSGEATGDYDGNEFSASVLVGYDHPIDRFTIGPRVGLNYLYTSYDSYQESGRFRGGDLGISPAFDPSTPTGLELAFDDESRTLLQSILGLKASGTFRVDGAAIVPELFFDWRHEFKDDQRSIDVRFVQDNRSNPQEFSYNTESPDRDFFFLGGAVSTIFDNGLQSFVAVRTLLGHDFYNSTSVSFGLRLDF